MLFLSIPSRYHEYHVTVLLITVMNFGGNHRLFDIHDDFSSFQQSLFPSEIWLWMHKVT